MAAFNHLSYSEHLEKLEGALSELRQTSDPYDYFSSSSTSPITTFDVQSVHSIVKGFVNDNFSFPNYGQKVERAGLNKWLYSKSPGRRTYDNPNVSLCSMVQNDDLKNYMMEFERKMSSIPDNQSDVQIKKPTPDAFTEKQTTSAERTRHPSQNGSVYSVNDMSISSLSEVDDIIVNDEWRFAQNTSTKNQVTVSRHQVPFLPNVPDRIWELKVISDDSALSDQPVEKNTHINEWEKTKLVREKSETAKDVRIWRNEEENGVVSSGQSPPVKCGKEIISGQPPVKRTATESVWKDDKGTKSASGEDSDVLVLNVNDTDNITEHSVTDDEKISSAKSGPLKEKDNLEEKPFNPVKSEGPKKIKLTNDKNWFRQSPSTRQNFTGCNENRAEITEKENKLGEKDQKPKYTIEDPSEINDINHPEWERISRLTTDEERYRAVKDCWGSDKIPNPNRDLTRHCFRWRRLRKEGYTSAHHLTTERKRTATHQPEGALDSKRQKMEAAPCTLILDRKIEVEKKLYDQNLNREQSIYHNRVHKAMHTVEKDKKLLEEEYRRKISQSGPSWLNVDNSLISNTEIEKWKDERERCISEKKAKELREADRRLAQARRRLENDHAQTLDKLNSARQEVLKFNQFYSGLNNLDPTVMEGRRIREATQAEHMYEFYQKVYSPSRL